MTVTALFTVAFSHLYYSIVQQVCKRISGNSVVSAKNNLHHSQVQQQFKGEKLIVKRAIEAALNAKCNLLGTILRVIFAVFCCVVQGYLQIEGNLRKSNQRNKDCCSWKKIRLNTNHNTSFSRCNIHNKAPLNCLLLVLYQLYLDDQSYTHF